MLRKLLHTDQNRKPLSTATPSKIQPRSTSFPAFFKYASQSSDNRLDNDRDYLEQLYQSGEITIKTYLELLNFKSPEFNAADMPNLTPSEIIQEIDLQILNNNQPVHTRKQIQKELKELTDACLNQDLCDKVRMSGVQVFCAKWNIPLPESSTRHTIKIGY
jgi:hypothetical protein